MPPMPDFDPDYASACEWAFMYRACGLQVIPCWKPNEGSGGSWKRPKLAQWTTYQNELVPRVTFDRWYQLGGEHAEREQMGIITGKCSRNTWVLDLDVHKNPRAAVWWNAVLEIENNGMELDTVEQRTGGGGIQKLFLAPDGVYVPTCRTMEGVDIRGTGGFAVMPPSLHESGKRYTWEPGAAPWERDILPAPPWLLEAVAQLVDAHGGDQSTGPAKQRSASPGGDQDAFGRTIDGRESLMRDVVWRAVLEWYRESPIKPPDQTWRARADAAYAEYERKVVNRHQDTDKLTGLERDGRGPTEFWKKFLREMRHWGSPKMIAAAAKPAPAGEAKPQFDPKDFADETTRAEEKAKADPAAQFELLDVAQIKGLPDPVWLIDDVVNEQSLGFIFGPPACLKTFIALDIALSITTGQPSWWNKTIRRRGAVIYISTEGTASLKFRIMAWEQHHKVNADKAPFYLLHQTINFMDAADIGKLLATVETAVARAGGPVAAIFVDTVSRVLPGAEENQQKDMTVFVGACDALRQRFKTVVFGVHHTNKSGDFRGSTVMPAAGDFLLEVRREPGAETGSVFAKKIKDAEDGWEQGFRATKILFPGILPRSSLVVDPTATVKEKSGWPPRAICQEILAAIDERWQAGTPWCFALNTPRSAVRNVMRRWRLERKLVIEILETWVANDVIAEQEYDVKNHISGYRKLTDI